MYLCQLISDLTLKGLKKSDQLFKVLLSDWSPFKIGGVYGGSSECVASTKRTSNFLFLCKLIIDLTLKGLNKSILSASFSVN